MYKHTWSLSQLQDLQFQTRQTQQTQQHQQMREQLRGLGRKRGMEEENDNDTPNKRVGWSGSKPDELSISSAGSSQSYQVAELQQQLQQHLHHQQSRSIYGFESPVSAPSTPVFESEPFVHLHHHHQQQQQVRPSTQGPFGLRAHPPTWAMEDVDLVRGVTTDLAASTLSYDDESISQEVEDGSLHKQCPQQPPQLPQPHQDTNLSQYYYVMGFRANCDKCQRRERGHFAHLVERPTEKA